MKTVYGILGSGTASTKVVRAALDDLPDDASFIIPSGPNFSNLEAVYDWLLDLEKEFVVVGTAGRVLKESAQWAVTSSDPVQGVLQELSNVKDANKTLLVMWDDKDSDAVITAHTFGFSILELSNGLVPITVEDSDPELTHMEEEAAPEPVEEPEEQTGFSLEELKTMPVAAVKRYALSQNVDVKGMSKDDILAALFPPAAPVVVPEPVLEQTPVVSDARRPVAVILVLENGSSVTIHGDEGTMKRIMSVL